MIRHVWSVLCKQVFVDAETDGTALVVLEALSLGAVMDAPPALARAQLDLVTLWYCDVPTEASAYKVKATGPSGAALAEAEAPLPAFAPTRHRARTTVRFSGLAYDGPGVYWLRVMRVVDGQEILDAEVPLAIA